MNKKTSEINQLSSLAVPEKSILLALSTFRQSEHAIETAIHQADYNKKLIVVYVVDANLAQYLIGSNLTLHTELMSKTRSQVLAEHYQKGEQIVQAICERACESGIDIETHVQIGNFALICLRIINKEMPSCVITTTSNRPEWVKKFFGSGIDYLRSHAACTVTEL